MSHLVPIPDDLYARIAAYAARQGQSPEEFVVATAIEAIDEGALVAPAEVVVEGYDPADDPLANFSGKFELLSADSIERHDYYLAGEAIDPHAEKS